MPFHDQPTLADIIAVESLLKYRFRNKHRFQEALTHSSYLGSDSSYERLQFVGESCLALAFSNHLYLAYPNLDAERLSLLRSANCSTEKLARVAVKWGLFRLLRHNAGALDDEVREFSQAVSEEDEFVFYGGPVKAPKILADIVESLAAAIFIDVNFDLQTLWTMLKPLLEPIIVPEDLSEQPQPITTLLELFQKQGKQIDIWQRREGSLRILNIHIDGVLVASGSSEERDVAMLCAANEALDKLNATTFDMSEVLEVMNETTEIEGAKQKLHELCAKKNWQEPHYKIVKEEGNPQERKYVCSVGIATEYCKLHQSGDERSNLNEAENSAASLMILSLCQSGCS